MTLLGKQMRQPVVIVGAWHMPPFFIQNYQGHPDGLCIDIMTTALHRRNIPYVIKVEPWEKSRYDILHHKADLICMMFSNENAKLFKFGTSIKYVPMCAVYRKGEKAILTVSDFVGKQLFVVKVARSHELINHLRYQCNIIDNKSINESFSLLSSGKGDAIFCNLITAQFFIRSKGFQNLVYHELPIAPQENRIAGNDERLLKLIDQEIYEMKCDGTYDKITKKWSELYDPEQSFLFYYIIVVILIIIATFLILRNTVLHRKFESSEKGRLSLLKRYKIIFDNAMVGILYYDEKGFLAAANEVARKQFCIPDDNSLKKAKLSIYDNPQVSKLINKSHLEPFSGISEWNFDKLNHTKFFDGVLSSGIHYFESRINPVYDSKGQLQCVISISRDVTEMINTQKELELEKEKAMQSDKLKSEFLANMSHEIRTPLNAIVGFADVLRNNNNNSKNTEIFRIISKNSNLLINLINDILDLSKIEAGGWEINPVDFDLIELIKTAHMSLQNIDLKPADVDFVYKVPMQHCIVRADQNRVLQIITNFVTNAFKYTHKGSVTLSCVLLEGAFKIIVEDTGIGIPKEKQDKVFARFEKIGSFEQGTGLGLAICKAITEHCGGSVGVESEIGKGSTFWSIIPNLKVK